MTTPEKIRELYDNEVTEVIKFNYHSTDKSYQSFVNAAELVNNMGYDPLTFIKAMFDYVWYIHTEKGFRRQTHPFPRMLCSKKADWLYNKYLSKYAGKPSASSIVDEVIRSDSIVRKLNITNERLFDLYDEGRISIYYLVLSREFTKLYNANLASGTVPSDFKNNYEAARRFIFNLPPEKFDKLALIVRGGNGK